MINHYSKVLSFLFCVLMLGSCTRYQYATISSPLKQNIKKEFVHENDSIKVEYNFHGAGGPIQIAVHNKLDTPLFINWRMSSLIINGQSDSYHDNVSTVQGTVSGSELNWGQGFVTTTSSFSGTVSQDDEVSYIPPGRFIIASPAQLSQGMFKPDPTNKPKRRSYATMAGSSSGRSYEFDRNTSPLHYQSYLSYSTHAQFATIATVEDDFWVSEIMDSYDKPKNILNMEDRQADTFYNSKTSGFGITMALLALIVLAAINGSVQQ